jgi:hypothetical protein
MWCRVGSWLVRSGQQLVIERFIEGGPVLVTGPFLFSVIDRVGLAVGKGELTK